MKLNEKSMSFAQKLLTHYPISEESHCEKECSHQHKAESFQPFQHMHDHRKVDIFNSKVTGNLRQAHEGKVGEHAIFQVDGKLKLQAEKVQRGCLLLPEGHPLLRLHFSRPARPNQRHGGLSAAVQHEHGNLSN